MVIDYNVAPAIIIKAVGNAGYNARLEGELDSNKDMPQDKIKMVLTIISGVAFIIGLMLSIAGSNQNLFIAFFVLSMLTGGYHIAKSGIYGLLSYSLDMNFLMTVSAIGAAAIKQWSEAAAVVFLFSLGNTLQMYAMDKTRKSIKDLMDIAPKEALVRRNGVEQKIPTSDIIIGDIVLVKPGEKIPVDGQIKWGISAVNQSAITGESIPVDKNPGDEVFAGTVNQQGALEIETAKLVNDTTLAKIIHLVEEAQSQKAKSQHFVDVFAKYYTPAVIIAAIAIATIPTLFFREPFLPWFNKALILLVISCPCALVISTPVAIVSAIGNAAKNGVLLKGGAVLEEAAKIKAVAFDKTGTLTKGQPVVTDIISFINNNDELITAVASIEARSEHPLAVAVVNYAREHKVQLLNLTNFEALTGMGVKAVLNNEQYIIGNQYLFESSNIIFGDYELDILKNLQAAGKSVMLVSKNEQLIGLIAMEDVVKENSRQAIQLLRREKINQLIMLSGDNETTAAAIAGELGISYLANLLPEDKLAAINDLQRSLGQVAMVGDGINDAPALAASSLGIAMGAAGTDVAIESADVALMSDDLEKIPFILRLGRKTALNIKENIGFSLAIKAIFIVLTFLGLSNLWLAVFADTGAALIVIINGMRLIKVK